MAAAKTSLGNDEIASMMDEAAQRTSNLYGEFYGFYPTLGMNENGLTDQFAVGIAVWANRNLGHNWKNLVNMFRTGKDETATGADLVLNVKTPGAEIGIYLQAKVATYDKNHPGEIAYAYPNFTYKSSWGSSRVMEVDTGQCFQLSQNKGLYIVYEAGATRWFCAKDIIAKNNEKGLNKWTDADFNREVYASKLAKTNFAAACTAWGKPYTKKGSSLEDE